MMKKLLLILLLTGILYGLSVFVSLNPNPLQWDEAGRMFDATVWAFMTLLVAIYPTTKPKNLYTQ